VAYERTEDFQILNRRNGRLEEDAGEFSAEKILF